MIICVNQCHEFHINMNDVVHDDTNRRHDEHLQHYHHAMPCPVSRRLKTRYLTRLGVKSKADDSDKSTNVVTRSVIG